MVTRNQAASHFSSKEVSHLINHITILTYIFVYSHSIGHHIKAEFTEYALCQVLCSCSHSTPHNAGTNTHTHNTQNSCVAH